MRPLWIYTRLEPKTKMSKIVLISIKPEFVNKIFNGTKKIELRKSMPKVDPGDLMVVYSTSPEMAVIGVCKIERIITSTPHEIWGNHSASLGIDKERFLEYYAGTEKAIGIVLGNTKKFRTKIPLKTIKERFPAFSPPQTFKYFRRSMLSKQSSNLISS